MRPFPILICLSLSANAISQCVPPTPLPIIACETGTPLTSNTSINAGDTSFFDGTGGSFTNISVNGGTLVLCGSSEFSGFNFNSGSLVINAGASVTFNGFNSSANNFYNLGGIVIFNNSVFIQGTNTFVYNAAGGSITVNGGLTVFNNGLFINNGVATAQDIVVNSGALICLGPSSVSNATSIQNNQLNALDVPSPIACLSYTTTFTGNAPITASSNLTICQGPTATSPTPIVIGSANVVTNCANCYTIISPLPLGLISFTGYYSNGQAQLTWITAWEEAVREFIPEQSTDGRNFQAAGRVPANNRPSTYIFATSVNTNSHFRIKTVDEDGTFSYSPTILIRVFITGIHLSVSGNPISTRYVKLLIEADKNQTGYLSITDNTGRTIQNRALSLARGSNTFDIDIQKLVPGQYYLHFRSEYAVSKQVSFVRL